MIAHYSYYCICDACSRHTFYTLARCALSEQEYTMRAKRYEQKAATLQALQKLREWNSLVEGG